MRPALRFGMWTGLRTQEVVNLVLPARECFVSQAICIGVNSQTGCIGSLLPGPLSYYEYPVPFRAANRNKFDFHRHMVERWSEAMRLPKATTANGNVSLKLRWV